MSKLVNRRHWLNGVSAGAGSLALVQVLGVQNALSADTSNIVMIISDDQSPAFRSVQEMMNHIKQEMQRNSL